MPKRWCGGCKTPNKMNRWAPRDETRSLPLTISAPDIIKAAFCPNRRTLFPNSRIWVQSVDEDSFPAYDEDAPLDVLGIVDIGWSQFYQVPHAPAYQIAVALKVAVLTAGGTEDFGVSHGNGRLFRHDQFCDKYPSILFRIAICKAANAANRIILLRYPPRRSPPAHPPQGFQSRPCPQCSLHRGRGLLFRPAFSASAL